MKKAIFLDRDGVINQMIFRMGKPRAPYELSDLELFPGVLEAVARFKSQGYLTIIVTNQPDVARGWVTMDKVVAVNSRIHQLLQVDEIKCCFHVEKDNCDCRKPRPGMLLEAARDWNIDCQKSFMVGDRYSDIEAGRSAGCQTILIGAGDDGVEKISPDHQSESLLQATDWILSHE